MHATAERSTRRDRLVPPFGAASVWDWGGPLLVTVFGGVLRFWRLGSPRAVVFDETYYVPEAYSILRHGVEYYSPSNVNALLLRGSTKILTGPGEYVVHPPLGKAMIAAGEWLFGLTPFGWRFAVALAGTLSILLAARITRRMTRSTLLGCVAGLLMALDGLELVLSRTAILDIFVMFWVLAAFGMLVLDRDAVRQRLAEAGTGYALPGGGPALGIRWRLVAAGVFLGLACASKWNGVWYIPAFAALAIAWNLGARRAAGYRDPAGGTVRHDLRWLPVSFGLAPLAAYLASWAGWFATGTGYDRNWAAANGNHTPVWSALDSWYQYQKSMLQYGLGLKTFHTYRSNPFGWLLLTRPTSLYYASPKCGSATCSSEVLAIGTPAIWWASMGALVFCLGWWIARRDWRAGAVLLAVAAGWLPWIWFYVHDNRTEFYFYAIVFLPYLVIAITLCLGLILGPPGAARNRRVAGAAVVAVYLLAVVADFAYLYPVLAAQAIPYGAWFQRMWFDGWI